MNAVDVVDAQPYTDGRTYDKLAPRGGNRRGRGTEGMTSMQDQPSAARRPARVRRQQEGIEPRHSRACAST